MPESTTRLLDVTDLSISHHTKDSTRVLVDTVDLHLDRGETIGIVGESGSGKSLSVRALLQLLPPSFKATGTALLGGVSVLTASERDMRKVRGREASMILQDPFTMLNPLMRVGRHLEEVLREQPAYQAMSRGEREAEVQRRLAEVGITDPSVARRYPFQLSGGMRQRVGIAATLATDPELIIADEPTTALDAVTQQDLLKLLISIQRRRNMSMIMITHDLRVAFSACDRVYVMYAGAIMEAGPSELLADAPRHPYTLGLLASEPPLDRRLGRLPVIKGELPQARGAHRACRFADRCDWAVAKCLEVPAPLVPIDDRRASACSRIGEIADDMDLRQEEVEHGQTESTLDSVRSAPVIVSVSGLFKEYGRGESVVAALHDVSLTVRQGEAVALVGESGSGKTTLGRCLVGLESITRGDATVFGIDITGGSAMTKSDRTAWHSKVQYVFQDPYSSLNPRMTVEQTLSEAIRQSTSTGNREGLTVAEVLDRVGLRAEYAGRRPAALSGGERQRVAIGRALALQPELLICDEPVSALDVSVQAQILNLLNDIRRDTGIALLFISHDLAVVRQIADSVFVLEKGRLVETGTSDVLDSPNSGYTKKLLEAVPRTSSDWLGKHSQMGKA
ncbi:dipeptide ABC transporter ATP-binding protein [Aeromicrobium sp. P5_D10]